MIQINSIASLKQFINQCNSLKALESVLKHSLNVSLVLYSDDEINEVKQAISIYLDKYSESKEMPLFITTLDLNFKHLNNKIA